MDRRKTNHVRHMQCNLRKIALQNYLPLKERQQEDLNYSELRIRSKTLSNIKGNFFKA